MKIRQTLSAWMFVGVLSVLLVGCGGDEAAKHPKPGTGDDIDFTVQTIQDENLTLLKIDYKVYVKGKLAKAYTKIDTLPNLGLNVASDSIYDENQTLQGVKRDTTLNGYRLFITSK